MMQIFCLAMAAIAACLSASTPGAALAQKGDGKDDVVGTIWHYKIKNGDKKDSGQFRVYKLEIFKGKEKVGTVKPKDEDKSTLHFTGWPEMKGTAVIRKVKRKPTTWTGTLIRPDGEKWDIEVEVKDK